MDVIKLRILRAEVQGQLDKIDKVVALLNDRVQQLTPNDPPGVESVAYQLHNFYSQVHPLLVRDVQAFLDVLKKSESRD